MKDSNPGIVGFQNIFLYMIVCIAIGIICAIILLKKYKNKSLKNDMI